MLDKLLNLKNTNKILFYVLIPIVALAFIVKFLMELNIIGAKRDIKKAEKETKELQEEKEKLVKKAEELEAKAAIDDNNAEHHAKKAKEIRNKIKEVESGDPGLDWHKKL